MPLIDTAEGQAHELTCACGNISPSWKTHLLHIIHSCPLDRCIRCFTWLTNINNPEDHECPSIQLMKLKDEIRELLNG